MTILYKLCTFLKNLYTADFANNKSVAKNDYRGGVGRGYRGGISQKYFLKNHKTKKENTYGYIT